MTPEKARTEPFDITDESLLRFHFTEKAQRDFGYRRREAELIFRDHHTHIVRYLRPALTRDDQFRFITNYLEELTT